MVEARLEELPCEGAHRRRPHRLARGARNTQPGQVVLPRVLGDLAVAQRIAEIGGGGMGRPPVTHGPGPERGVPDEVEGVEEDRGVPGPQGAEHGRHQPHIVVEGHPAHGDALRGLLERLGRLGELGQHLAMPQQDRLGCAEGPGSVLDVGDLIRRAAGRGARPQRPTPAVHR